MGRDEIARLFCWLSWDKCHLASPLSTPKQQVPPDHDYVTLCKDRQANFISSSPLYLVYLGRLPVARDRTVFS